MFDTVGVKMVAPSASVILKLHVAVLLATHSRGTRSLFTMHFSEFLSTPRKPDMTFPPKSVGALQFLAASNAYVPGAHVLHDAAPGASANFPS